MTEKPLVCPNCGGQLKLDHTSFQDRIMKCQYCETLFDIHDEASKQEFDMNSFLKNFGNVSTTVTSSSVIIKNGKVVSGNSEEAKDIMRSVQEKLKNAGINIDGFNQGTEQNPAKDQDSSETKK
jgi:hypothetical protein